MKDNEITYVLYVDIDGVLTNLEEYQLNTASEISYKIFHSKMKDPYKYDLDDIIGEKPYKVMPVDSWWDIKLDEYIKNTPLRHGASYALTYLQNIGIQVNILTSRTENLKEATIEWLNKNHLGNIPLIMKDDKAAFIMHEIEEKHICPIVIEDSPEKMKSLMKIPNCICLLFNAIYNNFSNDSPVAVAGTHIWTKEYKDDSYIRVYSWFDILQVLSEIDINSLHHESPEIESSNSNEYENKPSIFEYLPKKVIDTIEKYRNEMMSIRNQIPKDINFIEANSSLVNILTNSLVRELEVIGYCKGVLDDHSIGNIEIRDSFINYAIGR